jgi:putative Ca2+/H+ antiporter (TMEM165/GDT1 family)
MTALVVHLLGALIVGISAMGPISGIAAGIMFAIFGCFYLVVSAPFVLLGQILIDRLPSKGIKIISGIVLTIVGSIIGYPKIKDAEQE